MRHGFTGADARARFYKRRTSLVARITSSKSFFHCPIVLAPAPMANNARCSRFLACASVADFDFSHKS